MQLIVDLFVSKFRMLEMEVGSNKIRESLWDPERIPASRMAVICGLWIAPFTVHTLPSLSLFFSCLGGNMVIAYWVERNAWTGNPLKYLPSTCRKSSVGLNLSAAIVIHQTRNDLQVTECTHIREAVLKRRAIPNLINIFLLNRNMRVCCQNGKTKI